MGALCRKLSGDVPRCICVSVHVAENNTVFIRDEGMDLGVPMTDTVAAI